MNPETALILISHGSQAPEWVAPFQQMADQLRAERRAVYLAFMGTVRPTLMDAARGIMASPVRRCRVLPLFMSKGAHFFVDIPRQIAEVKTTYPELEIELMEPVGLHPLFVDLVRQIADEG
jgi:sirohydrochlorin cobaltochelatase